MALTVPCRKKDHGVKSSFYASLLSLLHFMCGSFRNGNPGTAVKKLENTPGQLGVSCYCIPVLGEKEGREQDLCQKLQSPGQ